MAASERWGRTYVFVGTAGRRHPGSASERKGLGNAGNRRFSVWNSSIGICVAHQGETNVNAGWKTSPPHVERVVPSASDASYLEPLAWHRLVAMRLKADLLCSV